jgi:hypothetical protein
VAATRSRRKVVVARDVALLLQALQQSLHRAVLVLLVGVEALADLAGSDQIVIPEQLHHRQLGVGQRRSRVGGFVTVSTRRQRTSYDG